MGFKNSNKSFKSSKFQKSRPQKAGKGNGNGKSYNRYNSDSDSDSGPEEIGTRNGNDSDFFSDEDEEPEQYSNKNKRKSNNFSTNSKKSKHAPTESSIRRPVSVVRPIPGLMAKSSEPSLLYQDVRFETALGKADYKKARRDYGFLDEYRQSEIENMEGILRNPEMKSRMSEDEVQDLKYRLQSTKSRLESLKAKDRESEVVKQHLKETGKAFLKRSDKRKLVQKDRFDRMSSGQRTKVMERKRKRNLGKEMRAFERGKN